MPPVSKKRKTTVVQPGVLATASQQRGIHAFGKVSKAQVDRSCTGKSKSYEPELFTEFSKSGEKRKRDSESPCSSGESPNSLPKYAVKAQGTRRTSDSLAGSNASVCRPGLPAIHGRRNANAQSIVSATPTKGARTILETLALHSSSTPSSSPARSRADTPPTSPSCAKSPSPDTHSSDDLPDELQDLIDLHSSFLTALSLHYAHHGSLAPVDLRILCPSVARAWRKRAVSVQDVQRILAITQQGPSSGASVLSFSDYGHGKICIEAVDLPSHRGHRKRIIDEEALNKVFCQNLEQQWISQRTSATSSQTVDTFLGTLALLPITTCSSLSKLTPLLAKGQRRLEDLKAGAIKAQESSSHSKLSSVNDRRSTHPKLAASRSGSLLSRIRAKETVQSKLPPAPTAAMLERKSSLSRLEEVIPVLELLTSGTINRAQQHGRPLGNPQLQTQTQSFTMPTLTQYLQMSLRNPISKDDAVRCVRLLAELVPEWVGVREVGKCIGVTIRRGGGVGKDEMDKRVRSVLEKL